MLFNDTPRNVCTNSNIKNRVRLEIKRVFIHLEYISEKPRINQRLQKSINNDSNFKKSTFRSPEKVHHLIYKFHWHSLRTHRWKKFASKCDVILWPNSFIGVRFHIFQFGGHKMGEIKLEPRKVRSRSNFPENVSESCPMQIFKACLWETWDENKSNKGTAESGIYVLEFNKYSWPQRWVMLLPKSTSPANIERRCKRNSNDNQ